MNDELKKVRINKAIAERGSWSRRKAEELILQGKVRFEQQVIRSLTFKVPQNAPLEIDGKFYFPPEKNIYLKMYKPIKYICSMNDPQGRKTIYELLPENIRNMHIFSIGRLDYYSEGLLLLTNDGYFAEKIIHPRYQKVKEYAVLIDGKVPDAAVEDMRGGMRLLDGTECKPVKVKKKALKNNNTLLHLFLRQGLNRQIRKMCLKWNLKILQLKRICIGNFCLDSLKPGEIEIIPPECILKFRDN